MRLFLPPGMTTAVHGRDAPSRKRDFPTAERRAFSSRLDPAQQADSHHDSRRLARRRLVEVAYDPIASARRGCAGQSADPAAQGTWRIRTCDRLDGLRSAMPIENYLPGRAYASGNDGQRFLDLSRRGSSSVSGRVLLKYGFFLGTNRFTTPAHMSEADRASCDDPR